MAVVLVTLVIIWVLREHAWGGAALVAVAALGLIRNRKAGFGSASGNSVPIVAAIFVGPTLIVLIGIFKPALTLTTAISVIAVYGVVAVLGRVVRSRLSN